MRESRGVRPSPPPEIRGCTPEEKKRGLAAKKKLEDLVLGKHVTFEFQGAGMYNRVRGVVRVDGVNVNEEMRRWLMNISE